LRTLSTHVLPIHEITRSTNIVPHVVFVVVRVISWTVSDDTGAAQELKDGGSGGAKPPPQVQMA
jgi:hypothetical protein